MVKIRLQLQGELRRLDPNAKIYRGTLNGLYQIGRYEGIKSLQKGLLASLGLKCCQSTRYGGVPHTLVIWTTRWDFVPVLFFYVFPIWMSKYEKKKFEKIIPLRYFDIDEWE